MQTAPCAALVTFEGEGDHRKKIETAQHSHQCGWCGRQFGEFTDKQCEKGHAGERCCLECEKEDAGRLLLPGTDQVLDNAIAKANSAKLKKKE